MANSVTTPLQGGGYSHHVSNVLGQLTSAQLVTAYPSLTQKTPTKSFSFPWNGHTMNFIKSVPVMCETTLAAALAAAGAPVV
jgi:hypothetical protein